MENSISPSPNTAITLRPALTIPEYLLPPGITFDRNYQILAFDKNFTMSSLFRPETYQVFVSNINSYITTNYPKVLEISGKNAPQLMKDFSDYLAVEITIYQQTSQQLFDSTGDPEYLEMAHERLSELNFETFLLKEALEMVVRKHPMYAGVPQTDLNNTISIKTTQDGGKEVLFKNPETISQFQANSKIENLLKQKLNGKNAEFLTELIYSEEQQINMARTLPIFV